MITRWVHVMIGAVLGLGCALEPDVGDGETSSSSEDSSSEDSSSEDSSSEDSSSEDSSSEDSSSEDSTSGEPLPACPPGEDATVVLYSDGPSLIDGDTEGGEGSEEATCTIDSIGGDAMAGWQLALTCDIEGGALAEPRTISAVTPSSPFAALDTNQPVVLRRYKWLSFEVGSGGWMTLEQSGEAMVIVYAEDAGGLINLCAFPTDSRIAMVNELLADFDARVEPGECDDLGALRLARMGGGEEVYVYSGQYRDIGDGVEAVVQEARCDMDPGVEFWDIALALWRG